jgi:hypothetical protein
MIGLGCLSVCVSCGVGDLWCWLQVWSDRGRVGLRQCRFTLTGSVCRETWSVDWVLVVPVYYDCSPTCICTRIWVSLTIRSNTCALVNFYSQSTKQIYVSRSGSEPALLVQHFYMIVLQLLCMDLMVKQPSLPLAIQDLQPNWPPRPQCSSPQFAEPYTLILIEPGYKTYTD